MAGALIVIEIAAPRVSDDALGVLVSSCTRAARGAECVLAKNATDESPSAVAIVSLQSEDKMRVEVGVRKGEHDSWLTKDFAFLAADDTLDRWRAVGFAIGTLAESDLEQSPEPPAPPAPKPPPTVIPLAARPAPRPLPKPAPGPRLFVSAGALFGPALDRGWWRLGSALGVELAPARVPFFFTLGGSAATRVARDSTGAVARWFDVSAGAGVLLLGPSTHSGVQLGAALLAEHFDVSAKSFDGSSAERGRWLFGVQAALAGRVEVAPGLYLVADVEGAGLSAATDVMVFGYSVGTAESLRYLFSAGVRVRLR